MRAQYHTHRPRHPGRLTHISAAVSDFFAALAAEAEHAVEHLGGFSGPIRPAQRPWSDVLDVLDMLAHEREMAA